MREVNYNGSILQMIKDVSSKPFNEMYWTHDRGVATFNYRPTPFDPENWKGLPIQEFGPNVITDINIGTNDQDQAAVYKLTPTQGLGNTQFDGGFNGNLAPLTNLELVHRYGYKLMQAQTDYFNGNDTENAEAGKYFYDLEIGANGDIFTIMHGILQIDDDITKG